MMGVMTRSMMNLLATRLSANSLCIPLFSRNESPSPVYAPSPRSSGRVVLLSKTPSLIRNVRRKLTCRGGGGSKTRAAVTKQHGPGPGALAGRGRRGGCQSR